MSRDLRRPRKRCLLQSWSLGGLLVAASVLTCAHVRAAEGGPDPSGYTWADTASEGPDFNYEIDKNAPPAPLNSRPSNSDDAFGTVDLDFSFTFYGESYNQVDIHSNGGLTFGGLSPLDPEHNCEALSFDVPTILPYWVDLYPQGLNHGVYYWSGGQAPNRYFVVEWYQIALWNSDTNFSQSDHLTFEVKLFEDGRIEFHYEDLDGDGSLDNGVNAAVLVSGKDPISGADSTLLVSCDTETVLFSGNAIGIYPPDCPDDDGDGVRICHGDCDDTDPATYPGAEEICDGLDNDCDSVLPGEEVDGDGDGYRQCDDDCDDSDAFLTPADDDEDGFSTCTGDCDDEDSNATPEDQDGDGTTGCDGDCDDDDPDINDEDEDNDGLTACEGDCDDSNNTVRPGNGELCDGLDNDCDGETDENPNCEGRGGTSGEGFDIAYGCIVSCNQGEKPGRGGLAMILCLLGGLLGSRSRRGNRP